MWDFSGMTQWRCRNILATLSQVYCYPNLGHNKGVAFFELRSWYEKFIRLLQQMVSYQPQNLIFIFLNYILLVR